MQGTLGRAGVYGRKSKTEVSPYERTASEALQVEDGLKWATREGYTVAPEHIWSDNESAYKAEELARRNFAAALRALERREIDVLWVYSVDRLSRRGARLIIELIEAGRRVYVADEDLDTTRPSDRRELINEAERALRFSQKLSTNLRRTKERQRRIGEWLNRPPYGFTNGPKYNRKLYAHPEQWPVVVEIYKRAAGVWPGEDRPQGTREIARALNARGIPSKWGKSWSASAVWKILANPLYEGWLVTREGSPHRPVVWRNPETGRPVRVVADGEPVISEELAERVRQHLAGTPAPSGMRAPAKRGTPKLLLIGLLRCAGCEGPMVSKGHGYGCSRHANGAVCPDPAHVLSKHIDEFVSARFLNRMSALDFQDEEDQSLAAAVAGRWTAQNMPEETREARLAQGDLKAAQEVLARHLADESKYPGAARAIWERQRDHYVAAVLAAEERVRELTPVPTLDVGWMQDRELLEEAWNAATVEERRSYLRLAIDRVLVKRGKRGARFDGDARVTIEWAEYREDA